MNVDPPTHTPSPAPVVSGTLPHRCEVLIVGAGPAGSACATVLAQAGVDVLLVDQQPFPRVKVCGDGLVPDTHLALQRLGVLEAVLAQAHPVRAVRCVSQRAGTLEVPGQLAVLPRERLDQILLDHAVARGAQFQAPWKLEEPIDDPSGRAIGARVSQAGQVREVLADRVVLATGGRIPAMLKADLVTQRRPSAVALRAYLRCADAPGLPTDSLDFVWHARLRPGYGWVFPCGKGLYNVGVGVFDRHRDCDGGRDAEGSASSGNLRQLLDAFGRCYAPAGHLLKHGEMLELRGAPLRCTLTGAQSGRPGVMATGEAIGSTYDFTGEGIGKAMETGILAAEAILRGREHGSGEADVRVDYAARLAELRPRFELYARANAVNRHPWLADLVVWRARRSAHLRRRMSDMLEERFNPGHLFTARGFWKLLTR